MKVFIMIIMFVMCFSSLLSMSNMKETIKYEKVFFEKECLSDSTMHLKVFFLINKYTQIHNVKKRVAFRVLRLETGYKGPFHRRYNHSQTSIANAYGSMQLLRSTANWVYYDFVNPKTYKMFLTKEHLLYDVDLNINLGIKYPSQIEFITDDSASAELADELKAIIDQG